MSYLQAVQHKILGSQPVVWGYSHDNGAMETVSNQPHYTLILIEEGQESLNVQPESQQRKYAESKDKDS